MIAVVGRKWVGELRRERPKTFYEHDFIRIEIETALQSQTPPLAGAGG